MYACMYVIVPFGAFAPWAYQLLLTAQYKILNLKSGPTSTIHFTISASLHVLGRLIALESCN